MGGEDTAVYVYDISKNSEPEVVNKLLAHRYTFPCMAAFILHSKVFQHLFHGACRAIKRMSVNHPIG